MGNGGSVCGFGWSVKYLGSRRRAGVCGEDWASKRGRPDQQCIALTGSKVNGHVHMELCDVATSLPYLFHGLLVIRREEVSIGNIWRYD